MTILVLPTAWDSALVGQSNLPLAAFMIFTAVDLARHRWSLAALWLVLGLAFKPVILAMLVFTAVLYRATRWRLAVGLLVLFVSPFFTQYAYYVLAQYKLFIEKCIIAGSPVTPFKDIFGIVRALGGDPTISVQTIVRIVGAVCFAGVCWLGLKRWGHERGTLLFLSFMMCFTLLFNPRTEGNSYILAGAPMALFASRAFLSGDHVAGWGIVLAIVLMSAAYEISRGPNQWLSPTMCIMFLVYLIRALLAKDLPA
jgi:hypothetical protein